MICDKDGTCWILSSAGIYVADSKNLIADTRLDYPLINAKRGFRESLVANSWLYRQGDELYLCCDSGAVKINMSQYDTATKSYRMVLDYIYVDGERHDINRVDTFHLTSQMDKIVLEPEVLNYSMNDPYVDLGLISAVNYFTEDMDVEMMKIYGGGTLDERAFAKMKLNKIACDIKWAYWALYQASSSNVEFDYMNWYGQKMARLQHFWLDPRLDYWLDIVHEKKSLIS